MSSTSSPLSIGFIEPHLEVYGGIRRILEFSNRFVDRGHDVTIYNGNCPFNCRLLDVTLLVSTAVVGSSAQLRNLSGGGGTPRSSVLSTAATGTQRNNDTQTFTFAAGGNLFLRRSDSGVAGTLILTFIRT